MPRSRQKSAVRVAGENLGVGVGVGGGLLIGPCPSADVWAAENTEIEIES